jgi:hypothetical protein
LLGFYIINKETDTNFLDKENRIIDKDYSVEKEWLAKKLKSLGLSNRKQLVELKLSSPHMPSSLLSVNQQCRLLVCFDGYRGVDLFNG